MKFKKGVSLFLLAIMVLGGCDTRTTSVETARPSTLTPTTTTEIPTATSTIPETTSTPEVKTEDFHYSLYQLESKYVLDGFEKVFDYADGNGEEPVLLFANDTIKELRVTQMAYMEDGTFAPEKELYYQEELLKNQAFCLKTVLPEGIPRLQVSFITPTQEKVETLLQYDGRYGGIGWGEGSPFFENGMEIRVENDVTSQHQQLSVHDGDKTHVLIEDLHSGRSLLEFSADRHQAAFVFPVDFEVYGNVYVFDSRTKQMSKCFLDLPEERTPIDVCWLDNETLLITEKFAQGTVALGGNTYLYNLKKGTLQKVVAAAEQEVATVASAKVMDGKLVLTIAQFTENANFLYYYTWIVDSNQISGENILRVKSLENESER